jgi:hypothetical protein
VVASKFLRSCDARFNFELSLLGSYWIARGRKLIFEKCDARFLFLVGLIIGFIWDSPCDCFGTLLNFCCLLFLYPCILCISFSLYGLVTNIVIVCFENLRFKYCTPFMLGYSVASWGAL